MKYSMCKVKKHTSWSVSVMAICSLHNINKVLTMRSNYVEAAIFPTTMIKQTDKQSCSSILHTCSTVYISKTSDMLISL